MEKLDENLMSHFYDDPDIYRAVDAWRDEGWVVGFVEFTPSYLPDSSIKGTGGQKLFLSDKDGALYRINPKMVNRV